MTLRATEDDRIAWYSFAVSVCVNRKIAYNVSGAVLSHIYSSVRFSVYPDVCCLVSGGAIW